MLGRILTKLFALFGMTLTCVACYGTPYDEYRPYFRASGRVVDEAGNPIPGIEASLGANHAQSNDNGRFYVENLDYDLLTLTDIDGEENGGEFESKEIELRYQGQNDRGVVTLERKNKEN